MQKLFTLGVEEEFQIVDPSTRDLRPHVEQMIASGDPGFMENIKREMIQSMVETVSPICETVEDARREVVNLRTGLGRTRRPERPRDRGCGRPPLLPLAKPAYHRG